jgi:hypothetical protein
MMLEEQPAADSYLMMTTDVSPQRLSLHLLNIPSHRIASHRIASHRIASHRIASHRIASHRIAWLGLA